MLIRIQIVRNIFEFFDLQNNERIAQITRANPMATMKTMVEQMELTKESVNSFPTGIN